MFYKVLNYIKRRIKSRWLMFTDPKRVQLHGINLNLEHESIPKSLRAFFYYGGYEKQEIQILTKNLSPADIVMEIGAGIGFLSSYCAKKIGSQRVHAYEANPKMIPKIQETYKLNEVSPCLHNVLLSENEKEVDFFLEPGFWSSSTIERSAQSEKVLVQSKNINKELDNIKPTFLIIDIEGGEKDLIPLIDFSSIRKIIIEMHPHVIGNDEVSGVIELVLSKGFNLRLDESIGEVLFFELANDSAINKDAA